MKPAKTNKKPAAAAAGRTPSAERALKELSVGETRDICWAENHLADALPKIIKGATSKDLKTAINHLEETKSDISRQGNVFALIGEKATASKRLAIEGLLKESTELLSDTDNGTEVRDAADISATQEVEYYEIACFGALRTLAGTLGFNKAQGVLDRTLAGEKSADSLLTQSCQRIRSIKPPRWKTYKSK